MLLLALACLLPACAYLEQVQRLPHVDVVDSKGVEPVPMIDPVRNNGAIFQGDRYRPLFEDHRARLVGDTITVLITEKVSATQKSTSTIDREGTLEASLTAVPFASPNSFNRARAQAEHKNNFDSKGTTENTNDFSGTITATVVRVLPNGHLIVAGEKQIGVNANVDVLRFSGQVDPRAVLPGNTVPSTSIANVRIEQRGRGQQAEAQSMGWLARFFLSLWPV
ncbi:MAG TPA: flagellar basal body L-ring protein FlgH [Burkholderiaceae bacterium]|nr:flagellar basal body L-ring protein FlgH [Burkholderiaceae bacterium]